jgi:hypothetical protein
MKLQTIQSLLHSIGPRDTCAAKSLKVRRTINGNTTSGRGGPMALFSTRVMQQNSEYALVCSDAKVAGDLRAPKPRLLPARNSWKMGAHPALALLRHLWSTTDVRRVHCITRLNAVEKPSLFGSILATIPRTNAPRAVDCLRCRRTRSTYR